MVLDNLLAEARKARLIDNYDEAIALCNAYLVANPDDPEGDSLLGLCELETNRPGGGKRIEGAVLRKPESYATQLNLSILREFEGNIRGAIQSASAAAQKAPGVFECWAQLGKLLGKAEKFEEAFKALGHAQKIGPDHVGVLRLLCAAALETARFAECETALRQLEGAAPPPEVVRIRAHLERKRGNWTALQDVATNWLKVEPSSEEARLALAHALAQQGYYDDAANAYAPLCSGTRPAAQHLAAIGRYRLGGRRIEEARTWFERALKRDRANAEAAYGLARVNHILGDQKSAEEWCRRTLGLDPNHADAFALLAELLQEPAADNDIAAVEKALLAPRLGEAEKAALLFAKGDFLHSQKRADPAFDAWVAANELKSQIAERAGERYDPAAHESFVTRLMEIFPLRGATRTANADDANAPTPIFIVGMPRSGTTLLETAIAAHPDVDGAGEVPAMPFILDQFMSLAGNSARDGDGVLEEKFDEWRALYFKQCARFGAAGAKFVTDKQPSNFLSVGLIAGLFPQSRIIYLRRNPVETSFSIYRRNFTRQWAFSTGLETIAHYYAEHCRIADYWLKTLGERIMFVQYEELARNFEPSLRAVVDFCGLSWDASCLNYHKSERAVITFSASQVRNPPSEKFLNSTAPYRRRLGVLIDSLTGLGVDLETGARRVD